MSTYNFFYEQLLQCSSYSICTRWYKRSHEGTTQVDTTAMAIYETVLTPLLKDLATYYPEKDLKMAAFAGDLTSAGRLSKLRSSWKVILDVGPK